MIKYFFFFSRKIKIIFPKLKNIIHIYLKPNNILLDSNMLVKLADFGLATTMNKERHIEKVTL